MNGNYTSQPVIDSFSHQGIQQAF